MKKINGIRGWYFPSKVIQAANESNQMLTMDFEYGDACRLKCVYCYRSLDERNLISFYPSSRYLSFDEWKRVVDEARELGVQSIKLIGGGEITEENGFFKAMEYIAKKSIVIVLFTAGTVLGDDKLCRKIHGISNIEFAKKLYDLGMSVFLKFDALSEDVQDFLAGMKGFTKIRNEAFKILLEMGFTNDNPTRLGLEVNVSRYNYHEIMEIYSLREKYNIYEDVVISMPCEMYKINKNYDISYEQKVRLYKEIYEFNRKNDIPYDHVSPFIGGLVCTQLGNGLYVNNRGNVYHCPGDFKLLGNIRETSLINIWRNFRGKEKYKTHYYCPFREKEDIVPTKLYGFLEGELVSKNYATNYNK